MSWENQGVHFPFFKLSCPSVGPQDPPAPITEVTQVVSEEGGKVTGHGWAQAPWAQASLHPTQTSASPAPTPPGPPRPRGITVSSGQQEAPERRLWPGQPGRAVRLLSRPRGQGRVLEWGAGEGRQCAGGTPRKATPGERVLSEGEGPQRPGTHQAPPERVRVGIKVIVLSLLRQVHQKRGQDEAEEADVPGSDQLLKEAHHSRWASVQPDSPPGAGGPACLEVCWALHPPGFSGWVPLPRAGRRAPAAPSPGQAGGGARLPVPALGGPTPMHLTPGGRWVGTAQCCIHPGRECPQAAVSQSGWRILGLLGPCPNFPEPGGDTPTGCPSWGTTTLSVLPAKPQPPGSDRKGGGEGTLGPISPPTRGRPPGRAWQGGVWAGRAPGNTGTGSGRDMGLQPPCGSHGQRPPQASA